MGGMRFDNDDIRALPLHMQEQVGAALVAQMESYPVAGQKEQYSAQKVQVRKLRFPNRRAVRRYLTLRNLARNDVIYDLILQRDSCHYVCSFTYTVMEEC